MITFPHIIVAALAAATLLKYHASLRKVVDTAAVTVKAAGPLVPAPLATAVTVASVGLDAFDDSQIAQEFAKRIAAAAQATHLDTVLSEVKTAALARFTPVPSATAVTAPQHPAAALANPPKP